MASKRVKSDNDSLFLPLSVAGQEEVLAALDQKVASLKSQLIALRGKLTKGID